MSRVDEKGTVHVTDDDPWTKEAITHMAHCLECNPYALPKVADLVSPCHNAPVYIHVGGYSGEVEVMCMWEHCHNGWDKDGKAE